MKAEGKILRKVLIGLLVVIVVLVIAFNLFGDAAITKGVKAGASKALGVNVALGGVHLRLLRGSVGMNDLAVDNPAGYSNKTLLTLKDARVKAEMGSMLSDTVKIDEIKLDGIDVDIEQKGLSTNLQDLLNGMKAQAPPAPTTTTPGPAKAKTTGKKLLIKSLEITNVKVKVRVLSGPAIPLTLKTIKMENIGSGGEPVDVAALTGKILAAIAEGIAQEGAGILPSDITGGLKSGLQGLENVGGNLLNEGKGVLEQGGGALKGLFEKKK
jgi:hypothetical protein